MYLSQDTHNDITDEWDMIHVGLFSSVRGFHFLKFLLLPLTFLMQSWLILAARDEYRW